MKTHFNSRIIKFVARVMLLVLLLASALSFAGCGMTEWYMHYNTHKEFLEFIEEYNSIHNLYVETFISFDLDDNEQVTERCYSMFTLISSSWARNSLRKNGYMYDIQGTDFVTGFVFYLDSDGENANEYGYKIKCNFRKLDFNFTQNDKIEILESENSKCTYFSDHGNPSYDLYYQEDIFDSTIFDQKIYNYVYHCTLYVNGVEAGCIHISSIEETSEEKLDEIIQMMSDSLVVINADGFFIWR